MKPLPGPTWSSNLVGNGTLPFKGDTPCADTTLTDGARLPAVK